MQDPDPDFTPVVGLPEALEPGLRRILAPNPSPMTFRGTNTYLLGTRDLAVIDPGPDDPRHLAAILAALEPGQRISHILVTHAHLDHAPLARTLSQATGAPVLGFGDAKAGRSTVMQRLAERGLAGGGEGVDAGFAPDVMLPNGAVVTGDGWQVTALHTPGHFGNHLSFLWDDAVFSGDLVMGWATSLVSPPDGDLSNFMTSCTRLAALDLRVAHAGHGAPIVDPATRLRWLIAHRQGREAEILTALADGPATAATLAARIYTTTPPALIPAATRNVFAHLVDLHGKSQVLARPDLAADAMFFRNG